MTQELRTASSIAGFLTLETLLPRLPLAQTLNQNRPPGHAREFFTVDRCLRPYSSFCPPAWTASIPCRRDRCTPYLALATKRASSRGVWLPFGRAVTTFPGAALFGWSFLLRDAFEEVVTKLFRRVRPASSSAVRLGQTCCGRPAPLLVVVHWHCFWLGLCILVRLFHRSRSGRPCC